MQLHQIDCTTSCESVPETEIGLSSVCFTAGTL